MGRRSGQCVCNPIVVLRCIAKHPYHLSYLLHHCIAGSTALISAHAQDLGTLRPGLYGPRTDPRLMKDTIGHGSRAHVLHVDRVEFMREGL